MARSANQKLKIIYLMDYLLQNTDEEHPATMADILAALADRGISAERKSIYDDLDALRTYGLDIMQARGKTVGYYVGARSFELPELKLLVDSVQSSRFITQRKTLALIRKIEDLTSVHQARLLQRQVYVTDRVKSMNESVYYNVDELANAISADRAIRFRYFEYSVGKEQKYRHNGDFYEVSPFALKWDNENYYLLAFDSATRELRHYRVDKMSDISVLDRFREGKEQFRQVDMAAYSKKVFDMFAGEEMSLRLRFSNRMIGAVIDRFGRDVLIIPDDGEHFTVRLDIVVSPRFYAWLFGFGADAEILSPPEARSGMEALLREVAEKYRP